jgi:hypothetical protein
MLTFSRFVILIDLYSGMKFYESRSTNLLAKMFEAMLVILQDEEISHASQVSRHTYFSPCIDSGYMIDLRNCKIQDQGFLMTMIPDFSCHFCITHSI